MKACHVCGDHGIVRANWSDAPDDFVLCLCPVGLQWRSLSNDSTPLYMVWCARNAVPPSRLFLLEEVLTPAELAERGFQWPATPTAVAREAALMAAGKRSSKR